MPQQTNWKTTLFGAITGIGLLIAQAPSGSIGIPASAQAWGGIAAAISTILMGYFAKDKTSAPEPPTK